MFKSMFGQQWQVVSTVVEQPTHDCKVEGSIPAATLLAEKRKFKFF